MHLHWTMIEKIVQTPSTISCKTLNNKGHHLCHLSKIRSLLTLPWHWCRREHRSQTNKLFPTLLTSGMGAEHKNQPLPSDKVLKYHTKSNANKQKIVRVVLCFYFPLCTCKKTILCAHFERLSVSCYNSEKSFYCQYETSVAFPLGVKKQKNLLEIAMKKWGMYKILLKQLQNSRSVRVCLILTPMCHLLTSFTPCGQAHNLPLSSPMLTPNHSPNALICISQAPTVAAPSPKW